MVETTKLKRFMDLQQTPKLSRSPRVLARAKVDFSYCRIVFRKNRWTHFNSYKLQINETSFLTEPFSFKQKNEIRIWFEKGSYYKKSTLARAVSRVSHDFESQFECLPVCCCLPTDCMAVKINGRTNYCHFYDHRRSLLDSHMTLENYAKV